MKKVLEGAGETITYHAREGDRWVTRQVTCEPELVCTAPLTPASDTEPAIAKIDVFKLTDVADTMEALGWPVSAALQRKWFGNRAYEMDQEQKDGRRPYPEDLIDTTTISLDWVLSFERALEKKTELLVKLDTPRAKDVVIGHILREKGFDWLHRTMRPWPGESTIPRLHERWQFQYVSVDHDLADKIGVLMRGLDDLFGALGTFSLYAAIGEIEIEPLMDGTFRLTIPRVVVYARDTYDFTDEQYLGHWNRKGVMVIPPYVVIDGMDYPYIDGERTRDTLYFSIRNRHYRRWRMKHGNGGDMLTFSDGRPVETPHLSFIVTFDDIRRVLAMMRNRANPGAPR